MKLLLFLGIALLVATASAVSVTSGPVTIGAGGSAMTTVILDSAPEGLSGYNVTVTAPEPVQVTAVTWPAWAGLHVNTAMPTGTATICAADINSQVQNGATGTVLATLTLSGPAGTSVTLGVTPNQVDDDSGNHIAATGQAGSGKAAQQQASATLQPTITPTTTKPGDLEPGQEEMDPITLFFDRIMRYLSRIMGGA